jgi:hypothetical protein
LLWGGQAAAQAGPEERPRKVKRVTHAERQAAADRAKALRAAAKRAESAKGANEGPRETAKAAAGAN